MADKIIFILNGCDISFTASAPKDITLEQLLKQCDKIKPNYCACGICSADGNYTHDDIDIDIDYNNIKLIGEPPCSLKGENENEENKD